MDESFHYEQPGSLMTEDEARVLRKIDSFDGLFRTIATRKTGQFRIPQKQVDRQKALNHLSEVFEMLGGVPAMAAWAYANPDEFYKNYLKIMPPKDKDINHKHSGTVKIVAPLRRSKLDESDIIDVTPESQDADGAGTHQQLEEQSSIVQDALTADRTERADAILVNASSAEVRNG